MAAITGTAVVLVTAYTLVIVVGLRVGMTAQTTEGSVIPAGMAVNTLIPLILVLSGEIGKYMPSWSKVEGTQAVSL